MMTLLLLHLEFLCITLCLYFLPKYKEFSQVREIRQKSGNLKGASKGQGKVREFHKKWSKSGKMILSQETQGIYWPNFLLSL